jgi:hypothetical protein
MKTQMISEKVAKRIRKQPVTVESALRVPSLDEAWNVLEACNNKIEYAGRDP